MNTIHAALEIGTSRTVLAIGETDSTGRVKVICHGEIPSTGVRKSQILDIAQATQSIRSVLGDVEKSQSALGTSVTIASVILAVSGQHVKADHAEGTTQVEGATVKDEEIAEVQRRAREMPLANGRELLDIVDQDYALDGRGGIAAPKGMSGRVLKLNALHIHADANRIHDARSAAEAAHIEIREPIFAAAAAAEAVLEDHERNNGCLVLDLGGGSTGYAVYTDGHLVSSGVVGVGGDHVTNDIAHAFQTTNAQAEQLKTTEASAMLGTYTNDNARVKINGMSALAGRTVSRRALDTVVNARLKELFAVFRETLEEPDLLQRLHAGVILTGGGASLRDIDALAQQELGLNVRLGRPIHVAGFEREAAPWSYAAIAGAILYSHRNEEDHSFLDKLFGRFF